MKFTVGAEGHKESQPSAGNQMNGGENRRRDQGTGSMMKYRMVDNSDICVGEKIGKGEEEL